MVWEYLFRERCSGDVDSGFDCDADNVQRLYSQFTADKLLLNHSQEKRGQVYEQ